jgi:two-component system sensor kinase FixL
LQEGFAIAHVVPLPASSPDDTQPLDRIGHGRPAAAAFLSAGKACALPDGLPDGLTTAPWRAAIAHELNQPLTALMIYLETMRGAARRAGLVSRAALRDAVLLDKAMQEATRAAQILQRMRALSDARAPERFPVNLVAAVRAAIARVLAGRKPISIIARVPHGPMPTITADPVHIEQILVNLVRNAVEAATAHVPCDDAPRVAVRVSFGVEGAAIAVSDNGPGLTKDVMARLFRPYASTKRGGLGLGLAIARRLARLHGGDIAIDPGRAGGGATFTLLLPCNGRTFPDDRHMNHKGDSK